MNPSELSLEKKRKAVIKRINLILDMTKVCRQIASSPHESGIEVTELPSELLDTLIDLVKIHLDVITAEHEQTDLFKASEIKFPDVTITE